jgi:very-short-patch-repair endonuclease
VAEGINNKKELKYYRKKLRKYATPAEVRLWIFLKGSKLRGVKFRRQTSIGNYIVDFYSYQYKLAIELDGAIHDLPEVVVYDKKRTIFLESVGVCVLRIKNEEVFDDIEGVLRKIEFEFDRRDATLPPLTPP